LAQHQEVIALGEQHFQLQAEDACGLVHQARRHPPLRALAAFDRFARIQEDDARRARL
jgi:hypothetical protein